MSTDNTINLITDCDLDENGFEKEDVGIPVEPEGEQKPFDPKKVDISITTPNLGALIIRLDHDEIDLMPGFQRSRDLWGKQEQSRLIESILIRLPIPAFYFDAINDDKWQVVDGLQRLSAIKNFVLDKNLCLTNLEFLEDHEGDYYDDLPRSLQRRIDEFQTSVYLIKPGTPLVMKYSLFHRINTGGLKLTPQEIRHAMSQSINKGRASYFLSDLVNEKLFKKVVGKNNNRMAYQELVLRHMTFSTIGAEEYKSSLPKFLDIGMTKLGEMQTEKLALLKENFLSAMDIADKLFGNDAFKKTLAEPTHKKVVNKPLFEAVSVTFASLDKDALSSLIANKDGFIAKMKELLQNLIFNESITRSTANKKNVDTRFKMVKKVIKLFLDEHL